MKLWCDCCDKVQPVEVTDERCAKTYAAYQDIVCAECRLVIAAGSEIRRTWVGLTDEDLAGCDESEYKAARYWETTLREKNT